MLGNQFLSEESTTKHYGTLVGGNVEPFSLVNVPRPFNLKDFCWRLLLDFCTHDDYSGAKKEAEAVGLMKGEVDPIQACRQRLRENKCLVVIDGLRSKDDWNQIRTELLWEQPTQSGCIIVITHRKSVANYCADDKKDRLLRINPLSDGVSLGPSWEKVCSFTYQLFSRD